MAGTAYDSVDDIAVLDGRRLVGIVPIEKLMAAEAGTSIANVMDADPPVVTPHADQEGVAWKMVKRNESAWR
jgi:magnesium transporter